MPRDASGNYTLPAGNPVVTGTTVDSSWANDTMDDIKDVLTDSLSRSGDGGMLVPIEFSSGLVGAPGITWTSEPTSGFYLAATNDMRVSIAGSVRARFRADANNPFQVWAGGAWGDILVTTGNQTIAGDWTFTGTMVIPEATVTAHEGALTLTASQISDISNYALVADLASTANAKGASLIGIEDSGTLITATNVEGALAELAAEIDTNTADVATNAADIATNAADIAAMDAETTGTFVVDWAGFTTAEAETWTYVKRGSVVTIHAPIFGAISNSTNFISGVTDVPAAIRPTFTKMGAYITRNNGTYIMGTITVSAAGQISLGGSNLSGAGGFTASGDKGYRGPQPFTYTLD